LLRWPLAQTVTIVFSRGSVASWCFQLEQREVLGAVDVAVAPLGRLAHVEDVEGAVAELFGECGDGGGCGAGEEAHGVSWRRRVR
jgi:hypothetical protein